MRHARVHVPCELSAAYRIISDHTILETMTPHIESVRMRSRRPDLYLAEEVLVLGGRRYLCMVRHSCTPPHTHRYHVVGGDAKGSHITETFEGTSDGTDVTAAIDWKSGLFGRDIREDYTRMLSGVDATFSPCSR